MARELTRHERILARHYLQELTERARLARDAVRLDSGHLMITDIAWMEQWDALKASLDRFTEDVMAGRVSDPIWKLDRNE